MVFFCVYTERGCWYLPQIPLLKDIYPQIIRVRNASQQISSPPPLPSSIHHKTVLILTVNRKNPVHVPVNRRLWTDSEKISNAQNLVDIQNCAGKLPVLVYSIIVLREIQIIEWCQNWCLSWDYVAYEFQPSGMFFSKGHTRWSKRHMVYQMVMWQSFDHMVFLCIPHNAYQMP